LHMKNERGGKMSPKDKLVSFSRSAMERFSTARSEEILTVQPEVKHEMNFSPERRQEVVTMVRKSISSEVRGANDVELKEMQKKMKELPFVSGRHADELLVCNAEDEGVALVDASAIVGTVSLAFNDWSDEYQSRENQIITVAKSLMNGSEEDVERVFHLKKKLGGIRLRKVSGPGGDLYFCVDGTHRVACAKLVGLSEVPARIKNASNPESASTQNKYQKREWENKIEKGLIKGSVEEETQPGGEITYTLKIESQVLPWMMLSRRGMFKMTQVYLEKYPGSLEGLSTPDGKKIPAQALTGEVEFNFFMAGRWDEYLKIQNEEKIREVRARIESS
jgi:hypothetical protein